MKKLKLETIDTAIEDIRNFFRQEKENEKIKTRIFIYIRNVFRLEKENKSIKDIIIKNIRDLFEKEEEENYCKPLRASNFWSNSYIEYESTGNTNKTPSVEEYLNKISINYVQKTS